MTGPITSSLEESFAEVRRSFRERLREEAASLDALMAQLPDPDAYSEIGRLAHRLAGASAIFGEAQLGPPAIAVEDIVAANKPSTQLLGPLMALIKAMRDASEPATETYVSAASAGHSR